MKEELMYKIDEEAIDNFLSAFIDEMITMGYSEWYIGKATAHIFKALERKNE